MRLEDPDVIPIFNKKSDFDSKLSIQFIRFLPHSPASRNKLFLSISASLGRHCNEAERMCGLKVRLVVNASEQA